MRKAPLAWLVLALLLFGLGVTWASDDQVAVVVAEVSSADHEVEEGYFGLGQQAVVMAKPGSELHRWLSSHRGQKVRLTLVQTGGQ